MTCLSCKAENPEGKKFCGECGNPLGNALIDAAVQREIERAVSTRLKEQKVMEMEAAQAVVTRLSDWAKLFGVCVAVPLTLLGVVLSIMGIRTYSDFSSRVSQAREEALKPLKEAKQESDRLNQETKDLRAQVEANRALVSQVQGLSQRVDQIERVVQFKSSASLTPGLRQSLESTFSSYYAYLKSLGFSLTGPVPRVFVDPKESMNSYYDRPNNQIVISPELAQFADSPLREFTHYALTTLRPSTKTVYIVPVDGLESGLADYFPGSFTNNADYGREIWELIRRKLGVQVPDRRLDNHRSFSELKPNTELHDAGNIWAGAFWQLRQTIGQGLTDRLLLASWKSFDVSKFGGDVTVYPRELEKQDEVMEGGKHAQDIRKVFTERGLKF